MRNSFPTKYAPRGKEQPIRGKLDSVKLTDDHRELVCRITMGLFLDMQNRPLADILAACYVSGMHHAIASLTEKGSE